MLDQEQQDKVPCTSLLLLSKVGEFILLSAVDDMAVDCDLLTALWFLLPAVNRT
jgi:hypothetical protein